MNVPVLTSVHELHAFDYLPTDYSNHVELNAFADDLFYSRVLSTIPSHRLLHLCPENAKYKKIISEKLIHIHQTDIESHNLHLIAEIIL